MIFVDSNIPMYLVGAPHPHKTDAQALLEGCLVRGERLVTDAEVLQEILHRYVAIHRRAFIQPALDALLGVVDDVFPIERDVVLMAKDVVLGAPHLSARDALHIAVMKKHGISRILTFDTDFDGYPGIQRHSR